MLHDADRLPSDLHVVPMQVSLRDVIAFGLLMGMSVTESERAPLEMTGPSSSITNSMHPLIGRLIHFSAFATTPRSFYKGLRNGEISRSWLHRLQGVATTANRSYDESKREHYEALGRKWRMNRRNLLVPAQGQRESYVTQINSVDMTGAKYSVPAYECSTWAVMKIKAVLELITDLRIASCRLPRIILRATRLLLHLSLSSIHGTKSLTRISATFHKSTLKRPLT